jgi:hypothetical protein
MANVSDMTAEMDDHGFGDTPATRKLSVLNDTIGDLCSREPWPFLQKTLQLSFDGTSGKASNFPADFRSILALTDPSNGSTIGWERGDVLRKRNASQWSLVATPYCFYDEAGIVRAYPIPPSAYKLDMLYLCTHPVVDGSTLEAAILLPARHHRILVVGSLYKLYTMEDDPELAGVFKQEYEDRYMKMREDLSRVQYDRPDRIWMTDYDDYDTYYGQI